MKRLNPEILQRLIEKRRRAKQTILNELTRQHRKTPRSTLNACAQIYAQRYGFSVFRMLDQEDKASLPDLEIHKPKVIRMPAKKSTKKAKIIFNYTTSDHFVTEHVNEINKAYSATCYTSAYILSRKVVENLIIGILRAQFPDTSLANKQLYYDIVRKRYLDFGVILQNLFDKRDEFPTGKKKAIERLYVLTKDFKDEANDRTHSLYHIVTKPKEIDELDLPTILALIADSICSGSLKAIF